MDLAFGEMGNSFPNGRTQVFRVATYAMTFFLIAFFSCHSCVYAQEGSRSRQNESSVGLSLPPRTTGLDSKPSNRGRMISPSTNLWSTAVSLGLMIGVLLVIGRGMKKYGFRGAPTLPLEAFELLGRRTIEPRVTVHLVKCGSRVLLLGVGTDGIRTLSEIDDPAEVERLTTACQGVSSNESRGVTPSQVATTRPASKMAEVSQRAFLVCAGLGLSLITSSPVEAQSTRAATTSTRAREHGPVRPAIPEPRPQEIQQAALERGLPFHLDPETLGSPQQLGGSLKMIAVMTVFSLAPSILMMTTCFVRFAVSLGLLRQALGTQQGLPNQVLTAICLFLSFLVMSPVWQRSYEEGIRPYTNPAEGEAAIDEATALTRTFAPVRTFMGQQIDKANNADAVWMLLDFQRSSTDSAGSNSWREPKSYDEVPLSVLAPAYLLSELKVGFLIGFQLFLPFLVIDLVVAMILSSLGLTMMPPSMVSLPFKLLLFVLIDGWFLTVGMLLESVRVV